MTLSSPGRLFRTVLLLSYYHHAPYGPIKSGQIIPYSVHLYCIP